MMEQNVYEANNAVTKVRLNSFSKSYAKAVLSCNLSPSDRMKKSQKLLDYLCYKFKIASVKLRVTDRGRIIKNNSAQVYGKYFPSFQTILNIIPLLRQIRQSQSNLFISH